MTIVRRILSGLVLPFLLTCCSALTNETSGVVDAGGGWVGNGVWTSVTAVGQPCPVGENVTPSRLNSSGFLHSFLLFPDVDTDKDGISDEDDVDDDEDGLFDASEIAGTAFDPRTETDAFVADSDGDGMKDGEEARAGTNPNEAESALRILGIRAAPAGDVAVTWKSREGLRYELRRAVSADGMASNAVTVTTVQAGAGTGVWQEASSVGVDVPGTNRAFYRVWLANP